MRTTNRKVSASLIQKALDEHTGSLVEVTRRFKCASCHASHSPGSDCLILPGRLHVCLNCVMRLMIEALPSDFGSWTINKVLTMLQSTPQERLLGIAACEKRERKITVWRNKYSFSDLTHSPSIFAALLACLVDSGTEVEEKLVRSLALTRLKNIFSYEELQGMLLAISPESPQKVILGAISALSISPCPDSDKLIWLCQWNQAADPDVRDLALQAIKQLGESDFVDLAHEKKVGEMTAELMSKTKLKDLNSLQSYVQSVTGIEVNATKKEQIARAICSYFAHPDAPKKFYSSLKPDHRKICDHLMYRRESITAKTLKQATGIEVTEKVGNSYFHSWQLLPEFSGLLTMNTYVYERPIALHEWLLPFLKAGAPKPAGATLTGTNTPSKAKNIRLCAFEPSFLSQASAVEALYFQGGLKLTKSGLPGIPGLRAMQQAGGYAEFFPDIKHLALERSRILAKLLKLLPPPEMMRTTPEPIFQAWLDLFFKPRTPVKRVRRQKAPPIFTPFLDYIKGAPESSYPEEEAANAKILQQILQQIPRGKWVTPQAVQKFMFFNELELRMPYDFGEGYIIVQGDWDETTRLYLHEAKDQLWDEAFMRAMFMVMAAIGVLEVALRTPHNPLKKGFKQDYLMAGDGLVALRLTPLGDWYFHQQKSDIFKMESTGSITLDERRLLIRLQGRNPVLEMTLEHAAESVGNGLYRINGATFLQGCRQQSDVQKKIEVLKSLLPEDLPQVWQNFLSGLLARINPLRSADYKVLKLNDSPELANAFLTDPKLKELTLKAEGGHILVAATDCENLRNRLGELGYFVEKLSS
jgi:hypothetical protein